MTTKEVNEVVCAIRRGEFGATLGYFDTVADVPTGWEIRDTDYNIADVISANRCTRQQALQMMNSHWQK